jgi:hypothetical protein
VLDGTWAFKIKRFPTGLVRKLKARFCVRGDQQVEGIDYFDTYAPVVSWVVVRLLLTMSIVMGLATKQVDYTNAFAQADLLSSEHVYVEIPKGFEPDCEGDKVLKLNKSLYGLHQSPIRWFDKLKDGLITRGFRQSTVDACLFLHNDMICVCYVDDCLFFSRDSKLIDNMIVSLKEDFDLEPEDDVSAFLGIKINELDDGQIELSQPALIERILEATDMKDCNTKGTPASTKPVGTDEYGPVCEATFEYAQVVGMLMYLSCNTRPDIAFAVHQVARFTHRPKRSHEEAIKRICRYLQGTKEKGIMFTPTGKFDLDCYVDADFAGLFGYEDDQDPVCVRSRTGYVLIFGGCPLLWSSKLQTEIALSTMEAEYIALSQSMRDLLPTKITVQEVANCLGVNLDLVQTHSTVFEDNNGALALASSPRMTPRSKHIGLKYHFFREAVTRGVVKIVKIDTELQKADIFTKGLVQVKFERIRKLLMGW